MINVIGDTFNELATLQSIINIGVLNNDKDRQSIEVCYKLSSGNILLVDSYNNIVGEKEDVIILIYRIRMHL